MAARAASLLALSTAEDKPLHVLWSGGIDSTAVMCALLAATDALPPAARRARLVVHYHARSIAEYPRFWAEHLAPLGAAGALALEELVGHVRDLPDGERLVVTGDPADMLFGTFVMAETFGEPWARDADGYLVPDPLYLALDEPWHEVVPQLLHVRGLLLNPAERARPDRDARAADAAAEWVGWMEQHVARAPIAVETAFDWMFWITYSCKCVRLRAEDGGEARRRHARLLLWPRVRRYQHDLCRMMLNRPGVDAAKLRAIEASIHNWYAAPDFHQWAFASHGEKMVDKVVWASYKMPMKDYIFERTRDDEYRRTKIKLQSSNMVTGRELALDDRRNPVAFGAHSVSLLRLEQKYGPRGLDHFLSPAGKAHKDVVEALARGDEDGAVRLMTAAVAGGLVIGTALAMGACVMGPSRLQTAGIMAQDSISRGVPSSGGGGGGSEYAGGTGG